MTPEIKTAWVKALRSGKYEPSDRPQALLQEADGRMSPIGVLIDVGCVGWWYYDKTIDAYRFDDQAFAISEADAAEIGLDGLTETGVHERFVKGWSFADIAEWIEMHV